MRKVFITNQKGGVGKTTIAFWIVFLLSKANKKVAIQDLDAQKDLTRLVQLYQIPLTGLDQAEFVIIDTPPRISDEQILHFAKKCQKILIPTATHLLGFERTLKILDLLQKEREKTALVLNLYQSRRQSQRDFLNFFQRHKEKIQVPIFILRNSAGISDFVISKLHTEERETLKNILKFILQF